MPINLARIDDRLIHGQVITTWVKNHDIEQVLIINDKVAGDKIQQSVLTMSAPPELKVQVFGVQKFIEILQKTEIKRRTMLLFTNSIVWGGDRLCMDGSSPRKQREALRSKD